MTAATLARPGLELRPPAYHWSPPRAYTLGPVVAKLADRVGFGPDPEQRLILDEIFAVNGVGTAAAFEVNIVAARQNLKTGALIQAALGWLFVVKVQDIVWSAHEYDTAVAAWAKLVELIDTHDFLSRRVKATPSAQGKQSIILVGPSASIDGPTLRFKARTRTGGRGLDGDKVVMDENFATHAEHIGTLMPLMSTKADPQIVYASSAEHEDSDVQRALDKVGRAGGAARMAHLEWADRKPRQCVERGCTHMYGTPNCDLDDQSRVIAANPSIALTLEESRAGRRITLAYIVGERQSPAMTPDEYARERLGWSDEPADGPALSVVAWKDAKSKGRIVTDKALAIDMSPRRDFTSIVLAGLTKAGKRRVRIVEYGRGSEWAGDRILAELKHHGLSGVWAVAGSQAATIKARVLDEGYDWNELVGREYGVACGDMYDLIARGQLGHDGRVELDTAVEAARLRDNGESVWVWSRSKSSTDISPLVASTAATHGSMTDGDGSVVVSLNDLDDDEEAR